VYNTIEEQQRIILDLVNNVVSDRERDLKNKNKLLKERIEKLEHQQMAENAAREARMMYVPMPAIVDGEGDSGDSSSEEESDDSS